MSLSYGGVEPQPSLAWTFESSNVDIVTSLAPSAQVSPGPAQLQGSAALVTNAPTSNTAVYLNGTSGTYMMLGTTSPANFDNSTSNIFVECYVYLNSSSSSAQNIFIRGTAGTDDFAVRYIGGSIQVYCYNASGASTSYSASVSTGQWNHVSFCITTTGIIYLYINGNLQNVGGTSIGGTPRYASGGILSIGTPALVSNWIWSDMYIRDLRVVQGGVVPVATFTPGAAPFSYASPGYVANMGTTVFTLLGQFITYPSGKYGQGLSTINSLSAVTSYLKYIPSSPITESSGFSISCWVNFLQLPDSGKRMSFVNLSNGTGFGQGVWLAYDRFGSGTFTIYYENTGVNFISSTYNLTAATGTWYHVCGTIGGGSANVYVNGVKGTTVSYSTTGTSYSNIYVCCHVNGAPTPYVVSDEMFSGTMDDLRIYNTALTATQVQSVYSSQGAPAPSRAMPLPKLAWTFDGGLTDYIASQTLNITGQAPFIANGKYGQSIILKNDTSLSTTSNLVDVTAQIPTNAMNGLSTLLWMKFLDQPGSIPGQEGSAIFSVGDTKTFIYSGGYTGSIVGNGSTSGGNIPLGTPLGVWIHYALVSGNGVMTLYANGVKIDSGTFTTSAANSTTFVRLGTVAGIRPTSAQYDDLRIFDRALTSAQVQSIYNQQGVPGRGVTGFSLPLDKVSGQVSGAYSTRLIRSAYTGPVVRVRRNSDSTQLDFISDVTGNLSNVSSAVSIASWLSATTGNVSTLYDQSGGSNNFTQSITSQQPQIVQNGGKWVVWFNRDATPTFYSNLSCATAMTGIKTIVYNFNTIYNAYQTILGAEQSDNTGFRFNSNKIIGDATGGRLGQDFLAAAGSYWYLNGAYGYMISNDGTTGVPSGNYIYNDLAWNHVVGVQNGGGMDGFGFNAISSPQLPIKSRAMNGYMSEIILFRNQLSAADSLYLYNSRYISRGSQIALTGTPLFSQLSSAATSSAVGAFSLRAVNGTSARAVQVRPQAQFPPAAMTGSSTSLSGYPFGGSGTYVASASTYYTATNLYPYFAFDKSTNIWASGTGADYTNGVATTNTQTAATYNGAWLQIQLPTAINLFSYSITSSGNFPTKAPSKWYILGSNDAGTTWTLVDSQQSGATWTYSHQVQTFTPTPTIAYSYYRIVTNQLSGSTAGSVLVEITELIIYGAPPNTATDFYADRLGNLLTAPVTGQSLANWLGGATGYVSTWYDQSGAGNHVSQTVAASQPSITTNGTIVFSGAQSFSNAATTGGCLAASAGTGTKYSYGAVWNPSSLSGYQSICEHNSSTGITSKRSSLLLNTAALGFNGQNNDIQALIGGLVTGTQYSTIARIDNTTAGYTANGNKNVRMRQNGVDYSGLTTDYTTLNLDNYQFVIGKKATTSGEFFSGSMKSIMVFKDALSDADTALLHAWQQSI